MMTLLQANANNSDIIKLWHMFDDKELLAEAVRSYTELSNKVQIANSSILRETLQAGKRVIFEAAQGTLLDEDYGFFPYVTRGKVTTVHAHELLAEVGHTDPAYVLGIVRAYAARHGPGAFPTENAWLRSQIHEQHNAHGDWQGAFRMGHFDMVATRYAMEANGQIDGLAITSIDQLEKMESFHFASRYHDAAGTEYSHLTLPEKGNLDELKTLSSWLMQGVSPLYEACPMSTQNVVETISNNLQKPVVAISQGTTREQKTFFKV
jgi:adenylosuccinate synthase